MTKKKDLTVTMLLIAHGHPVNVRNARGETPLHLAVQKGHSYLAASLLEHGAEVNAVSRHGRSARFIATQNNDSDMLRLLTKHGAHHDTFAFDDLISTDADSTPSPTLQTIHSVRSKYADRLERC